MEWVYLYDNYCSLKGFWFGMGEVVLARTSSTLHPLLLHYPVKMCLSASTATTSTLRVKNPVLYHPKKKTPFSSCCRPTVWSRNIIILLNENVSPQNSSTCPSFNELNIAYMPNIIRPWYFVLVHLVFLSSSSDERLHSFTLLHQHHGVPESIHKK